MAFRTCTVSFEDVRGVRHTVDVGAESLFEAVAVAVSRFRSDAWTEPMARSTIFEVEVREPATRHSVGLRHVERWLVSASPSPQEAAKKTKIRAMLGKR